MTEPPSLPHENEPIPRVWIAQGSTLKSLPGTGTYIVYICEKIEMVSLHSQIIGGSIDTRARNYNTKSYLP